MPMPFDSAVSVRLTTRLLLALHNINDQATNTVLITRIITALILAPIAIGGIFFLPPLGFALFTGVIIPLGAWEWANMSGIENQPGRVGYALVMAGLLAVIWQLQVPAITVLWLALL